MYGLPLQLQRGHGRGHGLVRVLSPVPGGLRGVPTQRGGHRIAWAEGGGGGRVIRPLDRAPRAGVDYVFGRPQAYNMRGCSGASHVRDRSAVGRRGQGQDRRSADRAARHRGPLPGRGQRRPHGRGRRSRPTSCTSSPAASCPRTCMRGRRRRGAQPGHACWRRSTAWLSRGVQVGENLMLSDRAHVIFPWHFAEDRLLERASGERRERSAPRCAASAPATATRWAARFAIRLGDMYRADFRERIEQIAEAKTADCWPACGGEVDGTALDADADLRGVQRLRRAAEAVSWPTRRPTCSTRSRPGKTHPVRRRPGGAAGHRSRHVPLRHQQQQFGRRRLGRLGRARAARSTKVIGIVKAYTTRVGGGPFPTEQDNEIGQHIRDGATSTARPPAGRGAAAGSTRWPSATRPGSAASTRLSVMLLDVLSQLPEMKICTAYELDGERITAFPQPRRRPAPRQADLRDAAGLAAGHDATRAAWRTCPPAPDAISDRISELVGRPVEIVSVGPDREQTILSADTAVS